MFINWLFLSPDLDDANDSTSPEAEQNVRTANGIEQRTAFFDFSFSVGFSLL